MKNSRKTGIILGSAIAVLVSIPDAALAQQSIETEESDTNSP